MNDKWTESLLIDYWSHGYVKIEVMDGERFHEDIFLGEVLTYNNFHINFFISFFHIASFFFFNLGMFINLSTNE